MAKRKQQPLQLLLFDELTLKSLERVKERRVKKPVKQVKETPVDSGSVVVDTIATVWGQVEVTAEMDFIIQECGYSSLEGFLTGEEWKPPRPPTKRKKSNYAVKRAKGRSAL